MKLEIEKAFLTEGRSVYDFFQRPGVGFYIPLYQREYSWDRDNVDQLIEDIEKGVTSMIDNDSEIRFLGTIITVVEKDKKRIQPLDPQALPTAVEKLIDGQQRMSTIALIGTQLYKHFSSIEEKFSEKSEYKNEISEICRSWKEKLLDIFSFDLKRGEPKRKPKVIRGHMDEWTKDGNADDKYISDIANYLAKFILCLESEPHVFPDIPKNKSNFSINTNIIDKWLSKIRHSQDSEDDSIPSARRILKSVENHEFIWSYERPNLKDVIDSADLSNKKSDEYLLCSLVKLISVTHYLLERCCFTIIQPINEDWAFDMFQSLNASGTPLTAIETFKPLVVNTTELNKEQYEKSISKKSFSKVEDLFKDTNNAASKSKLTNEFLTSLAIVLDGSKLESHFSSQRKYLDRVYTQELNLYTSQCDFINFIGNYAEFYKNVWIDYKGANNLPIDKIATSTEADLASLLLLFLKRSNHRMSITILGCFYNDVISGKPNSIATFVEAVKAISAFYILWRACDSNAGIDNYYRNYFKGKDDELEAHHWLKSRGNITISDLKEYLKNSLLSSKKISDKSDWVEKASNYLKYDNSSVVCRISLLIYAHDTIIDENQPGLVKIGKPNSSPYLKLEKWNSNDLKDIEHIAPQESTGNWDEDLYKLDELYDSIGNLTLLPSEINISASNKGWNEKYLYYQHLGTKDPQKAQELSFKAKEAGIILNETTINLLQNCNYNEHILPILAVGEENKWDATIVKKRGERILSLLWDKVMPWLESR